MASAKNWDMSSRFDPIYSEKWPSERATLLPDPKERKTTRRRHYEWQLLGLLMWALVATAATIFLAFGPQNPLSRKHDGGLKSPGKRNLIFMVSDGMGPGSLTMTREFHRLEEPLLVDNLLVLDQHLIGTSRTRSNSSLITDSAAGATAFSCGKKSYNGAISMMPDFSSCGTVLEAAKRAGYMTGLVVTTDITDATPACFASHVRHRKYQDSIALQEIGVNPLGRVVDLLLGGGRCHFLSNGTEGSCRNDNIDVIELAQDKFGWNYIDNRQDFDYISSDGVSKLPLLGLFAGSDIPYELDRRQMNHNYPSLNEMASFALKALEKATQGSEKGFFLMIEGSRIDHAGHGNDPAAQVREVLAYDQAFSSVVEFLKTSETEGVLVSTSDHETGGLSVAKRKFILSVILNLLIRSELGSQYPSYRWYPEALHNASNSAEYLSKQLGDHIAQRISGEPLKAIIRELVREGLGIVDASEEEIDLLYSNPARSAYAFADMVSRRAQIGWSTHGHSATDVNIYGTAGSETLRGNHENTEVGEFLHQYLDVDVDAITKELNGNPGAFRGPEGSFGFPIKEDI